MIQFAGMLIAIFIDRLIPKRRPDATVRRVIIALLVVAMLAGFIFSYFWGPPRP